jgi:hypothetical protein
VGDARKCGDDMRGEAPPARCLAPADIGPGDPPPTECLPPDDIAPALPEAVAIRKIAAATILQRGTI